MVNLLERFKKPSISEEEMRVLGLIKWPSKEEQVEGFQKYLFEHDRVYNLARAIEIKFRISNEIPLKAANLLLITVYAAQTAMTAWRDQEIECEVRLDDKCIGKKLKGLYPCELGIKRKTEKTGISLALFSDEEDLVNGGAILLNNWSRFTSVLRSCSRESDWKELIFQHAKWASVIVCRFA